jgi:hypothetical protein
LEDNWGATRELVKTAVVPLVFGNQGKANKSATTDFAAEGGFTIAIPQQAKQLIFRLLIGVAASGVVVLELPAMTRNG